MCGRYGLYHRPEEIAARFQAVLPLEDGVEGAALAARYNIAPTQSAPVIRLEDGVRLLEPMRWGLIPFWAKDPKIGSQLINARGESLAEKPAFRNALKTRRCLVPASGFYEWHATADGKQPLHIRRSDGVPFAFAGLWEQWRGPDGPLRSYTIVTTTPNELMGAYHHRMPVILTPEEEAAWLDPTSPVETLTGLVRPYADGALEAFPVSRAVNRAGFEGPECLQP
jgi:putative SOS response-associated peptidase YedK